MLHIEFQESKPSGSEKEDLLNIFSMYFYYFNLGPPWRRAVLDLRPSFEQT